LEGVGVIGAVADALGERHALEQRLSVAAVRRLSRVQQVAQRLAATVGQEVDLPGRAAA
jgi:hypothetical protein